MATTVAQVRALLGDLPAFDRQIATGDGSSTKFIVTKFPIITGSDDITIDAVATTAYTVSPTSGVITFTAAPALAAAIVIMYEYAELADETISAVLALEDNAFVAAAMCAESLAGKYSSLVDKKVGDLSISYSQRAKSWMAMAKKLRAASTQGTITFAAPKAGGTSRATKDSVDADTDRVQPAFYKGMHEEEVADVLTGE